MTKGLHVVWPPCDNAWTDQSWSPRHFVPSCDSEANVRTLHLFLERGFSGESVTAQLEGQPIFESDDVTSDLMMGFAAQVDAPLPPEGGEVKVAVSSGPNLNASFRLPHGDEDLWVRVWQEGGRLQHEVGTEPLGFL